MFAGVRAVSLQPEKSVVSVSYKWFNKNPFHSVYFAILAMAAEISTGILCMGYLYKQSPSISMLLVKTEGSFYKKAVGKILFTCADGQSIKEAVEKAIATKESTTVMCHSTGVNEQNEIVADFYYTWSFKVRIRS